MAPRSLCTDDENAIRRGALPRLRTPGTGAIALVLALAAWSAAAHAGPPAPRVYNEIIGTGQSLSTGMMSTPAISVSADWPGLALMTNLGVRQVIDHGETHPLDPNLITALVPLVEAQSADHDGETIGAGMAFEINELALEDGAPPWPLVFTAHGVGGAPYSMLKRGTVPYRNSIQTVKRVDALLARSAIRDVVRAVTVTHGESDFILGTGGAQYEADLVQWRNDYDRDIRAITGQRESVLLFTDQMSAYTSRILGRHAAVTSPIPLAQLAAAIDDPDSIILVGPKYWLHYEKDGVHLTNRSEELLGEKYGEAVEHTFVEHQIWRPLYITAAAMDGSVITLSYHIPSPPLALDTELVRDPGNYGFVYGDDSGAPPVIRGVELDRAGTHVLIRLSAPPAAAQRHRHVRYAFVGSVSCGGGGCPGGPLTGPRGNLRDSDPLTSRLDTADHLYNWAVIQDFAF